VKQKKRLTMLIKLKQTLKILFTGQFKTAWYFFTFVGAESLDTEQEEKSELFE